MTKRSEQNSPAITCCGAAFHEITVQGGGSTLSLSRCTGCGRQRWTCDGVLVPRDTALERLASSYRKIPSPRPPSATADASARRTARREATVSPAAAPEPKESTAGLVDLLEGWQVLGAAR